jgi:hypothetical protein
VAVRAERNDQFLSVIVGIFFRGEQDVGTSVPAGKDGHEIREGDEGV